MSSLVNQVLQDDQVFAILGGEGRGPRRHSPLVGAPLQETLDDSMKIDEFYSLYGRTEVCCMFISQKNREERHYYI